MARIAIHVPFLLSRTAMHIVYDYLLLLASQGSPTNRTNTQDNPAIEAVIEYMLSTTSADLAFHSTLSSLLDPKPRVQSQAQVHEGLVLCERLINVPVQIAPHIQLIDRCCAG
ncbi:hypothetical protein EDC04DRAFT_2797660, partial [Pisolithus marmoratus]